jgi:hypothetical protein
MFRPFSVRWATDGTSLWRGVDSPNLIFVDFNVTALAPRLNWTATALQLSESITLFIDLWHTYQCHRPRGPATNPVFGGGVSFTSVYLCIYIYCITLGTGRSLEAPMLVFLCGWPFHLRKKLNFRADRNELIRLIKFVDNFHLRSLYNKPGFHVVPKGLSISKNTAAVDMLLLKFTVTWSVNLIHCNVVLWRARKPKWLPLSRSLTSTCFWTIFRRLFRKVCP